LEDETRSVEGPDASRGGPKEPPQNVVRSASYHLAQVDPIALTRWPHVALVDPISSEEPVCSRTTQQHVVAETAVNNADSTPRRMTDIKVPAAAGIGTIVVSRSAIDQVITVPASDTVAALAATDFVVSETTDQNVISFESEELDSLQRPWTVTFHWVAEYFVPMLGAVDAPAFDGEAVIVLVRGKPGLAFEQAGLERETGGMLGASGGRGLETPRRFANAVVEPVGLTSERGNLFLRGCPCE
jgi:hypothetical protein